MDVLARSFCSALLLALSLQSVDATPTLAYVGAGPLATYVCSTGSDLMAQLTVEVMTTDTALATLVLTPGDCLPAYASYALMAATGSFAFVLTGNWESGFHGYAPAFGSLDIGPYSSAGVVASGWLLYPSPNGLKFWGELGELVVR